MKWLSDLYFDFLKKQCKYCWNLLSIHKGNKMCKPRNIFYLNFLPTKSFKKL